MSVLQDALSCIAPTPWEDVPTTDLKPFLAHIFASAQTLVDSVPIPEPSPTNSSNPRPRAASNASEISESNARSSAPSEEVDALKKAWGKPIKVGAKENPVGVSVYKMAGKDGNGAWFARRSVHEGLGFQKWKRALEAEFSATMKVKGAPGEGNIRGIGGERRVEFEDVADVGRIEVFHLSAQFPGPTTPRDFVTLLITSEAALNDKAAGVESGNVPRHFMVISRPVTHSSCPERQGFIRGQYQSVEFIREIPKRADPTKSASTSDLPATKHSRSRSGSSLAKDAVITNAKTAHESIAEEEAEFVKDKDSDNGRSRSKTTSDLPSAEDESEQNPVEWIMITRSDPGGSVPRFMIERGTPGGICGDAKKFLDWACSTNIGDFPEEVPGHADESGSSKPADSQAQSRGKKELHEYDTNGHLAGLQVGEGQVDAKPSLVPQGVAQSDDSKSFGLLNMLTGAAGAAGATIAAYTPEVIKSNMPGAQGEPPISTNSKPANGRLSTSSVASAASSDSFASATSRHHRPILYAQNSMTHRDADAPDQASMDTCTSAAVRKLSATQEKELQRLEDKKRKLDERLIREKEKELSKKAGDAEKEKAAIEKAEEKHRREVEKQEEKYRKEVARLEERKARELEKAQLKKVKELERDERVTLKRELEALRAEHEVVAREREMLRVRVDELVTENEALKARGAAIEEGEARIKDIGTGVMITDAGKDTMEVKV